MLPLRWPITLVAGLLIAGAWAGRKAHQAEEPPPPTPSEEPAAEPAVATAAPAPAPEQVHGGPLFPQGLPLAGLVLPEGLANPTAQACAACHGTQYDQWEGSAHATGWQGERWSQAVRDASQPEECQACHLPFTAQHTHRVVHQAEGQADALQHAVNPDWSPSLQREGVSCAACHLREGRVLGPRADARAPHPVAKSDDLGSPVLCAACHQLSWPDAEVAWYDTYGEWYRSPYREAGLRCQDCHMPPMAGLVTTGRFAAHAGHAMATDPSHAVSVLLELDSPVITRGAPYDLRLRVQNTGAGHAFPTGHPGKAYVIRAVVVDAEGEPLHDAFEHRLVREVQPEPPFALVSDSRIPARGELLLEHQATIPQKKPAGPSLLRVSILDERLEQPLLERTFPVTVE
jgi:hypothetical protein